MPSQKRMDRIIDMHIHILPGLDDGSRNMVETLKMLKIATSEGITDMIVTPHYKEGHQNASPSTIQDAIRSVEQETQKLDLNIALYPGNEVYYFHGMEDMLDAGKICTMNHTDYVLIEFSPLESYTNIWNAMDKVASYGYSPILAHVERYQCMLDDWHNVKQLKRLNVRIQVNASSITGETGYKVKRFTANLLKNQIVDYVGTDAHRCEGNRIPAMKKCEALLLKRYDPGYVEQILCRNVAGLID